MSAILQRVLLNSKGYDPDQEYRNNIQKIMDVLHNSEIESAEREIQRQQIDLNLIAFRAFEP